MGKRRAAGIVLVCSLIVAFTPIGVSEEAQVAEALGLRDVFEEGFLVRDSNGDGVVDAISARIVLPTDPTPAEVAAAANIAARLGFESSGYTPGLALIDTDFDPQADPSPLVLIGADNRWVRRLIDIGAVDFASLGPGQGSITVVESPFGGGDALVVVGADAAGIVAAANGASGRLPFIWQLRGKRIGDVQADLVDYLSEAGFDVQEIVATAAVYESGKEEMSRLGARVRLMPAAREDAVAALEQLADAHVVGKAIFTDRLADRLNYPYLANLEVDIVDASRVPIPRFGPPYRARFPENPWIARTKLLDLSNLYSIDGLFGDSRGNDMIADESETVIIIGSAGTVPGVVELAARIGMETAGLSLPLAFPEADIEDPTALPNPILVGAERLIGLVLPGGGESPGPGQGVVRVLSEAFGAHSAIVVSGGDAAGVDAATDYMAAHAPFLWEARRGEVSLEGIGRQVEEFFQARSSAGQAAAAVEALREILNEVPGRELTSLEAAVYLEEESPEFAEYLRLLLEEHSSSADVATSAPSRYGPVPVFEVEPDLGWEVDELRQRFAEEVLSMVEQGSTVGVEALTSEGPAVRAMLEAELLEQLEQAGAVDPRVRVISAYKQGFSWLADYVVPAIRELPVSTVTIEFPEAVYPEDEPWYGQSIRWLQEIYPIDWIIGRELGIDVDATSFEMVRGGEIRYRVTVRDRAGEMLYRDEFAPRYTVREYFPYEPTAKIHYTTGGVRATIDGETVADFDVRTDPERFWDYYQAEVLPRMFEYAIDYTGGDLGLENQPFFRDLRLDVIMSEPDFRLGLDEERISSLDSLHEDLVFDTIDFWTIFSGNEPGSREVAPGRILPVVRPSSQPQAPEVKISFLGNAAPRPRLTVKWRTANGHESSRSVDLEGIAVASARATGVVVQAAETGVSRLTVSISAESFAVAAQAVARVESLAAAQEAGAFSDALAYFRLDELEISVETGNVDLAAAIAPVDPAALRRPGDQPTIAPAVDERIVTWDHVIGPAEMEEEILPRLGSFPEITPYVVGRTYRGRNVWAMDVMLATESRLWSQAKASTMKPVLFITTRQHSNEVSATSAHLRFMELVARDPDYRKYLDRINIVYNPMENPDGAANHQIYLEHTPTYILHGGYWSSVMRDVGAYVNDPDPLLPEGLVRNRIYYTWIPDVYMNPHGYPSHEWVHQFAGYKVPWFLAFWIPRGYHINLNALDDANYPLHRDVGRELRERIIEEVQGNADIRAANERLVHRFEKYARRYEPAPFRLEIYKGMNILFEHSYSFREGGPDELSDDVYVSAMGGRPDPQGRRFIERHPHLTVLELGSDMPDETASPEWMNKIAAPGQFGYLMAVIKLMYESEWQVYRYEEDFGDQVRLSWYRPRPIKASRPDHEAAWPREP